MFYFSPKILIVGLSGIGVTAGGLAAWRLTKRTNPVTLPTVPETLANQDPDSNLEKSSPDDVPNESVKNSESKAESELNSNNQEGSQQVIEKLSDQDSGAENYSRQLTADPGPEINRECGEYIWNTNQDQTAKNSKEKNFSEYFCCLNTVSNKYKLVKV